jgi:uncharacterized protein YbbC (DUF1343 family)
MRKEVLHILFAVFIIISPIFTARVCAQVKLGIDVLATQHPTLVRDKRLAVFVSKGSLDMNLTPSVDRLSRAATIKTIITCDGFFRETIPSGAEHESEAPRLYDALTNALVYEYLDPSQKPMGLSFEDIDLLVIDIQDIGIRYFKYVTAMAQLLELARLGNKPVILLDRPNPIGGNMVSGFVLKPTLRSHFGVYPIPLVYGMTFGELALYFNKIFGIGSNLTVIGMEGYKRGYSYDQTGLHWVPPFAHVNFSDTPLYYAITGILGETGVFSTGVGTTRPFRYLLAPWLDGELLAKNLEEQGLPGIRFISTKETPYYGLFAQRAINGIELVITRPELVDPFQCSYAILKTLYRLYPEHIPLANNALTSSINLLVGNEAMCEGILQDMPLANLQKLAKESQLNFLQKREEFLIYTE